MQKLSVVSGAVLLLGALGGQTATAQEVILPGSLQADNIQAAVKFLRSMGYEEVGDDITLWLQKGYISVDDIGGADTGDTSSITKKIRLDKYNTQINQKIDPVTNFAGVVQIATILFHEKIHAHQALGLFEATKEYSAWSSTIQVLDKWILTQTERYKLSKTEADREKLEVLMVQKQTELQGFINEHKCFPGWFGYRGYFNDFSDICIEWKTLLSHVKVLLREVAKKSNLRSKKKKRSECSFGEWKATSNTPSPAED